MRPPRVLTCGFVALDTLLSHKVLRYAAGGTAGNVAASLAFLGWDAAVAAVVGDDEAGVRLRRDLATAGVDITDIAIRKHARTPQVIHDIKGPVHRFLFRCSGCGRRLAKSQPPPRSLVDEILDERPDPDVFFFDRASLFAVTLAEAYAERGVLVFFEPATPGRAPLVTRACRAAHIVKMSQESPVSPLPRRKSGTLQTLIVTAGANGARLRHGSAKARQLASFPNVRVADAAGAGDWTTAGFLHALLATRPFNRNFTSPALVEALRWGQAIATLSCRWHGARGLARNMTAADLEVRVASLLAGADDPAPSPSRERFRPQLSKPLCNVCLG
jgi:fructokinase